MPVSQLVSLGKISGISSSLRASTSSGKRILLGAWKRAGDVTQGRVLAPWVGVGGCGWVWVCVGVGGCVSADVIPVSLYPLWLLSQWLSVVRSMIIQLGWLASDPKGFTSRRWYYKHEPSHLPFLYRCWGRGSDLRSSCLLSKHFVDQAISPSLRLSM